MNKMDELRAWPGNYGYTAPDKKLRIYYAPEAFAKTVALVRAHPVEVGWNMVIKPYKNGYKVYDILVYPQKVSAAYISVDLPNWGLWKAELDEEQDKNLFGHGHSHVEMQAFASFVDVNQQHDEILAKQTGFYFFQIWNKKNDIVSFFYDLDNKIFYNKDDIEMIVECGETDTESFVENSFRMVTGNREKDIWEVGELYESEQVI